MGHGVLALRPLAPRKVQHWNCVPIAGGRQSYGDAAPAVTAATRRRPTGTLKLTTPNHGIRSKTTKMTDHRRDRSRMMDFKVQTAIKFNEA